MNVLETKKLILTRLEEMRSDHEREAPPAPEPVMPAVRRRRRAGWFGNQRRSASSGLEQRLAELEDRLMAVERSYVGHFSQSVPQRLEPSAKPRNGGDDIAPLHSEMAADELQPSAGYSHPADDGFDDLPYRLTGSAEDGLMTDVLQILASNQKSGRFSFFAPGEAKHLDLYFRDGEVIHAKAGDEEGEAAFFSIMIKAHEAGKYGFLDGDDPDIKQSIEQKTQFLILEALRRIDEERNSGDGGDAG